MVPLPQFQGSYSSPCRLYCQTMEITLISNWKGWTKTHETTILRPSTSVYWKLDTNRRSLLFILKDSTRTKPFSNEESNSATWHKFETGTHKQPFNRLQQARLNHYKLTWDKLQRLNRWMSHHYRQISHEDKCAHEIKPSLFRGETKCMIKTAQYRGLMLVNHKIRHRFDNQSF